MVSARFFSSNQEPLLPRLDSSSSEFLAPFSIVQDRFGVGRSVGRSVSFFSMKFLHLSFTCFLCLSFFIIVWRLLSDLCATLLVCLAISNFPYRSAIFPDCLVATRSNLRRFEEPFSKKNRSAVFCHKIQDISSSGESLSTFPVCVHSNCALSLTVSPALGAFVSICLKSLLVCQSADGTVFVSRTSCDLCGPRQISDRSCRWKLSSTSGSTEL